MAHSIEWSEEARTTYTDILLYLEVSWGQREIDNFIERVDDVLELMTMNPAMYPMSRSKGIHRAVISKQTSLYYLVVGGQITLLSFTDNRQDPKKRKY